MPGDLIVRPVADAIREVAAREGRVSYDQVDWSAGPAPFPKVRQAILRSLQDDLYISAEERGEILKVAGDEYQFVDALIHDLRDNQPLYGRLRTVQNLLNKRTCGLRTASFWNCVSQSEKMALRKEMQGILKVGLQHAMDEARQLNPLDSIPKIEASKR